MHYWARFTFPDSHIGEVTARPVASIGDENAPLALPPSSNGMERTMKLRLRATKIFPLNGRLKLFSDQLRSAAAGLRPGLEQDDLLKRARVADTAAQINEWISSPGLQPPK